MNGTASMRLRRLLLIVAGLAAGAVAAGAVAAGPVAAQAAPATSLHIELAETLTQGAETEIVVALEDAARQPVSGEIVRLSERVAFFGYVGDAVIGEARTDYRGRARLKYTPPLAGAGQLTAEFAGSERLGPAFTFQSVAVAPGVPPSGSGDAPSEALLPRGVTAIWFLVVLAAVWSAIGVVVYNIVRIPFDRGRPASEAGTGRQARINELLAGTGDPGLPAPGSVPPSVS